MKKFCIFIGLLFCVVSSFALGGKDVYSEQTYQNLKSALQGETDARAKYLEYSKIAKKDGNSATARLFLAAADGELLHIENSYNIANAMKPFEKPVANKVTIGDTLKNLTSIVDTEKYEASSMYPDFLATAKKEGNEKVQQAFMYASKAESTHATLFKEELAIIKEKGISNSNTGFYLCPICGKVEKGNKPTKNCDICGARGDLFIAY